MSNIRILDLTSPMNRRLLHDLCVVFGQELVTPRPPENSHMERQRAAKELQNLGRDDEPRG